MTSKKDDDAGEGDAVALKPKIGLLSGVSIIVGSIIGSGIFISPKGVIQEVGSVGLSLIIWHLCGLFSMVGDYCYTELGTANVRSGADYAYLFEAFGPFVAFLRLWVESMIIRPCMIAIVSLTFANYVIEPLFPTCEQPEIAVRLLAAICITILTAVNTIDVKLSMRVQNIFTYAKLFALVLIIITGIVQLCLGEVEHFRSPFEGSVYSAGAISIAFYQGLFAYNGWNYLNYVIEELKEPNKNLPKASWISCTLVTVIYVLANVAYFTTVSPAEMVESSAVAVMFAQRLYGFMSWIMPVFVALSTFGGVNGILFTSSRLFYVGSREGHMPKVLCFIQVNRLTPAPAVIFMGATSLIYLTSTDMYKLINYVSFVCWLAIGLSVVALLYFRYARPAMKRPIRVGLFWPILYVAASVFLVIVPLVTNPVETGLGVLITCTGIPVYIVCVKWKSKPKSFTRLISRMNICIQKLLLVMSEEKGSD
jgi:amino acid transporter